MFIKNGDPQKIITLELSDLDDNAKKQAEELVEEAIKLSILPVQEETNQKKLDN